MIDKFHIATNAGKGYQMPDRNFCETLRERMSYQDDDCTRPIITLTHKEADAILRVVELLVKMRPHLHAQWKHEINAVLAALTLKDRPC